MLIGEEREIIGIFTSEKELALALYQHRKELEVDIEYKDVMGIIEEYGVMELPHCLSTKPMHFFRGNIIDYELNIEEFMYLSDIEKKMMTLQVLKETVIKVFEELQIDSTDFEKACEQIKNCNYKNEWIWKKKKNKNFIAEIVLVHEVKTAQIFLRIYKNKEYIREFEILSTYPDEFYFSQYLGRIKWVDDKTVAIEQKNGINYLLIDINRGIIKDWSEKE